MSNGAIKGDAQTLGGVAGAKKWSGNRGYIYAYVAASITAGTPLVLTFDGDEETNPKGATPATNTTVHQLIIFTTVTQGADAGFMWCQFAGDAKILVDGTTDVTKDDFLKVINAGVALIKDATSRGVNSIAIAQEAMTTNAATLTFVYLLGYEAQVPAS